MNHYEYCVSFDPGNALYYNWFISLTAHALTFGKTGERWAALLTASTNHSKKLEKIADVVEASLGVASVAARVKELNEFLAEILPAGCSISSLYHPMSQNIRQHNQGGGGSTNRSRKSGNRFGRSVRHEGLSLTFLNRYQKGVGERDGPLQAPSGTVLQPGASQLGVVTLSASVHRLASLCAAAAEASLSS